jgi:arylsulfatase A-like enzyme
LPFVVALLLSLCSLYSQRPLQSPDEYVTLFENKTDGSFARKVVCAMAKQLDDMIGNVTSTLSSLGLWENTLVIFTSDNGGPTNHNEATDSNNYPLRGGKNTLWQGGAHLPLIMKGAGLQKINYINNDLIYATDFLPSLVSMAIESMSQKQSQIKSEQESSVTTTWMDYKPTSDPSFQDGDGINLWNMISKGEPSPRDYVLLETHPFDATNRTIGDAIIVNQWKLIKVTDTTNNQMQDGW